ncbi:MAG: Gfo/Idh/MocA family oxidoreductase, partial [Clostridia bacterium]
MKQITVAIVGCGARGMETYAKCLEKLGDQVKIIAAADINAEALRRMQEKYALPVQMCFSSAEEILRQPRLADAMLICTPDRLHYEQALRALRLDYHLLLEKPISSSAHECKELARVAIERKRHVIVCHVLRYTVFYQKVKEIIDSGVLGDVVSIQAIEQVGYWHQAHSFVRGNWRDATRSTPMILQKCCHDMDIFLWLTGKHGKRVSSFGSLRHFKAENAPEGVPMRCTDGCPVKDTCPYNAERFYLQRLKEAEFDWPVNVVISEPSEELLLKALREGPYGCCVYHCDNDVVDHQVVNVEFEDGLTLNFTMCAFTAHGGRTLRVMGTHGELTGDMKKNIINVMPFVGKETE